MACESEKKSFSALCREIFDTILKIQNEICCSGKLTKHQISEGYTCLKMIEKFIISKKFEKEFVQAVNEYYTKVNSGPHNFDNVSAYSISSNRLKIPHAFGFQRPKMIYTPHKLKQELELLDLLQDIEIAITRMGKVRKGVW